MIKIYITIWNEKLTSFSLWVIHKAVKIAWQYAQYDGSHHKMWVIDQMVRVLLGETEYRNFIDAYQTPDGEDYYTWDMGIAP